MHWETRVILNIARVDITGFVCMQEMETQNISHCAIANIVQGAPRHQQTTNTIGSPPLAMMD